MSQSCYIRVPCGTRTAFNFRTARSGPRIAVERARALPPDIQHAGCGSELPTSYAPAVPYDAYPTGSACCRTVVQRQAIRRVRSRKVEQQATGDCQTGLPHSYDYTRYRPYMTSASAQPAWNELHILTVQAVVPGTYSPIIRIRTSTDL